MTNELATNGVAETTPLSIHAEFARDLRAIADFIEAHPELHLPLLQRIDIFEADPKSLPKYAAAFGKAAKDVLGDNLFILRRTFGTIKLEANWTRDRVCERVVVGQREIPDQIIPAKPEEFIPGHKEDVYEWRCPESILSRKELTGE
jgi:hypothetical protein